MCATSAPDCEKIWRWPGCLLSFHFSVPPSATSTSTPDFAFVQIFARRIYLLLLLLLLFLLLHRSLRGMCLTATCTTTSLFTL